MTQKTRLLESIRANWPEPRDNTGKMRWVSSLPGGDINQAALISDGATSYFLKYHPHVSTDLFAAEAQALNEISKHKCVRVPQPVLYGHDGQTAWLVMEYLELTPIGPATQLGEQLAAMHSIVNDRYGWAADNFIGTTTQHNTFTSDWTNFWRDYRLKPQLALAETAGFGGQLMSTGEKLLQNIDQLLDGHQPEASLLHGDFWAGNKAYTHDGRAVIFDPASYYGDRETDIAMSELFGGFDREFYAAYEAHTPLPDAYPLRRDLYNLYHMLNHLNLFGASYLPRCEAMIASLLAQIR